MCVNDNHKQNNTSMYTISYDVTRIRLFLEIRLHTAPFIHSRFQAFVTITNQRGDSSPSYAYQTVPPTTKHARLKIVVPIFCIIIPCFLLLMPNPLLPNEPMQEIVE